MLKINIGEARKIAMRDVPLPPGVPRAGLGEVVQHAFWETMGPGDVGRHLLGRYSQLRLLAITNGPEESCLLERLAPSGPEQTADDPPMLHLTTYHIPSLRKWLAGGSPLPQTTSSSSLNSLSRSLPKPTQDWKLSGGKGGLKRPEINPLGAGDTCSGVFLTEYLDSEVGPLCVFVCFYVMTHLPHPSSLSYCRVCGQTPTTHTTPGPGHCLSLRASCRFSLLPHRGCHQHF
jgi:hypothetical protein